MASILDIAKKKKAQVEADIAKAAAAVARGGKAVLTAKAQAEQKLQTFGRTQVRPAVVAAPKKVAPVVTAIAKGGKQYATGLAKGDVGQAFGDERLNNTAAGVTANTILGLPKAGKEVLFPTRGYTEKELAEAKPTASQYAQGLPKTVAEIADALGDLPTLSPAYQRNAERFSKTKIGSKLADAGAAIARYGKPTSVEEAKAMRLADVAGFLPVGSLKAVKAFDDIPEQLRPLAQEAAKYKSADAFVKAQGKALYHGSPKADVIRKEGFKLPTSAKEQTDAPVYGEGVYFSSKRGGAYDTTRSGVNTIEGYVPKDLNLYRATDKDAFTLKTKDLKEKGYDGIEVSFPSGEKHFVVFDPAKVRTREMLTDLYDKVHGTKTEIVPNVLKPLQALARKSKTQEEFIANANLNGNIAQALGERYKGDGIEELLGDFYAKTTKPAAEAVEEAVDTSVRRVDQLIAEGKIRVVSRNGTETYQYKKGDKWTTAPTDEDAVLRLTNYEKGRPVLTGTKPATKAAKESPIEAVASRKPAPPIAKSEGEVRSIEAAAERHLGTLDEPARKGVSSLPEIIEKSATPVKAKVNLLDYIRTPDRVLTKIGFGTEAKQLKAAYNAYAKELPKNIDKITDWSKRAPAKGAEERIFKWLDGQAITLSPSERAVASEIKDWLRDWADRLGLPEDNRIAHYITHIFDEQLIAKEFDEDLAKIISERIPSAVYDPFLEKRLGAQGFKEDVWAALDAYVKRATRKTHLDPVLERIQAKSGSSVEFSPLEESQFRYIQRYINSVNMRPTELDNILDNTIKSMFGYRFGQRPVTRLTSLLRRMTYRGMLGLNPGSALRNLSQGINTYAVLGEKYTALGYASLFKKGAMKELADEGVLANNFIQDRTLSATKKAMEKIDKGLFVFFDGAEKINRGAAYFGAKRKALNAGKTPEEAIQYAKDIVAKTQFNFSSVDTPVAMSSDIVKTLAQFQTYTVKQTEFLAEMAKNKDFIGLTRYGVAGMAFVYTIGQAFGMEPKELIPSLRLGPPPSLKLPWEVTKAVLDVPDKYGKDRDLAQKGEDIFKSAIGLFPAGTQMKKTFEGLMSVAEGGSFDKNGKLQFAQNMSLGGKVQSILFGKYAGDNSEAYFDKLEGKITPQEQAMKDYYEQVQALKAAGKPDEAVALFESLSEDQKVLYKSYRQKYMAKETAAGKQAILPEFQRIRALKARDPQAAVAEYEKLSDQQKKYYQLVKKQVERDEAAARAEKPEYVDGEVQTPRGIIGTVTTYAKAIGKDPMTAFEAMFTDEELNYVAGNVVVLKRLPAFEEGGSQDKAEALAAKQGIDRSTAKLDHVVPLQLGGDNGDDNLQLVPTEIWETYTPVENYLGKLVRDGKIGRKAAQDAIKAFKAGKQTFEEIQGLFGVPAAEAAEKPRSGEEVTVEEPRVKITRAQRNNNPLNIKLSPKTATYAGAESTDPNPASDGGHFIVFASAQDGFNAAKQLLTSEVYEGLPLDAALKKWSNKGYGAEIVPQYADLAVEELDEEQLQEVVIAMARAEGYFNES